MGTVAWFPLVPSGSFTPDHILTEAVVRTPLISVSMRGRYTWPYSELMRFVFRLSWYRPFISSEVCAPELSIPHIVEMSLPTQSN